MPHDTDCRTRPAAGYTYDAALRLDEGPDRLMSVSRVWLGGCLLWSATKAEPLQGLSRPGPNPP